MKPSDIQAGRTYRNRGKGTTKRKVLRIEKDLSCNWYSTNPRPDEPVVEYEQGGCVSRLYLSSFASWAGFDDTPEDDTRLHGGKQATRRRTRSSAAAGG